MSLCQIEANGWVFDAAVSGTPGDPLVLMLHGFPQTRHTWRHQMAPLAAAGFHAVAPDQRGYSSGARPADVADYRTEHLVSDALAMMDALGYEQAHVVGHDWGGQLSWLLAAHHPHRVSSLTVLSRPHPQAFVAAFKADSAQANRSRHHKAFQDKDSARLLLEDGARRLRATLSEQGVPEADQNAYLSVLNNFEALDAAINWYRAPVQAGAEAPLAPKDTPYVTVPTLYIWGDADATVGRAAAEGTAACVRADYRFEILPAVGHFVTDQAGARVSEALLNFLNENRAS